MGDSSVNVAAKRAIISVSDKTGAAEFARGLIDLGYEIISTGGTKAALERARVAVTAVEDITGFPECLDGRVKTLHPRVFAGILAMRQNAEHIRQADEFSIGLIDLVAVNLYPFKATVQKEKATLEEAIENIDIGGPSMIRAAAKNHPDVCVITDPADYQAVLAELRENGKMSFATNFKMAAKAFAHTAAYDALIAEYLGEKASLPAFGDSITLTYDKVQDLRYGENPHQAAAFYKEARLPGGSLPLARQIQGKELSFNNINDANGALMLLYEFTNPANNKPTVVASKHTNPCGVATGRDIYEAWDKAYRADPTSIFGGIIAVNRSIDGRTAELMEHVFLEIVIAPGFDDEALAILGKKKNLRLLMLDMSSVAENGLTADRSLDMKRVYGGLLAQEADIANSKDAAAYEKNWRVVTKNAPTDSEMDDLRFAWRVVKHVKSNGIAIAKNGMTLGVGPGQVNRVWAVCQAIDHGHEFLGEHALNGASLASDAFFPFPDCVEEAHKAGVTAIIQPGGSNNDHLSIAACNERGIAMVFTGERHFKH